ncbi:MAG: hypothetical protein NC924_04980 [Candidatus Omnitrophica bacterium]|nr:hypothetical protein [Candidatus Omnitrophota bacterium]
MPEKNIPVKKLALTNTKQEMLDSYNALVKQLEEKEKMALKPEDAVERKKSAEAVKIADGLSLDGIVKGMNELRMDIGKVFTRLADSLESELGKYEKVKAAVEVREKHLQEIYGIERAAQTLAALLEAQAKKREEFEQEMSARKTELTAELDTLRVEFQNEKKNYEAQKKERDETELKKRQREREEYDYAFKREQQQSRHGLDDDKSRQEKELSVKKESVERDLLEREKKIADAEKRLAEMQKKLDGYAKEMDAAVQCAVKETAEKLQADTRLREELLNKTNEGEKNVLRSQVEALERTAKDQKEQISRLSQQLEKAYQKIEDIAVKTVSGVAEVKASAAAAVARSEESAKKTAER